MKRIKIAFGVAFLIGAASVVGWGLTYKSWRPWRSYLCDLKFSQGAYTLFTPSSLPGQTPDPNEKLNAKVTVAHAAHYVVGTTLHVSQNGDGSILVPHLADRMLFEDPGWGGDVNGVRIGVMIDHPVVKSGEPLYAQVTIENHGKTPFYFRNGCGANLHLALPEIDDANGNAVRELFRIGQDMCSATFIASIPPQTTAFFIFNVRDLYVINSPGKYTMSIGFPTNIYGPGNSIMLHHSGRVAFEVR